jgi:uncharacterized protein YjbI with pentapeptide repeats
MTSTAKRKLTLVCTALALCLSTTSPALAACDDPAGPGVDWSWCPLYGADLRMANLTGANLSYAGLIGATWTDGSICAEGSIGQCK